MEYDNTNRGVAFSSSGFTGKINIDGQDYQLAILGASDKAKFKFTVFIHNRNEVYQTVLFDKDKKSDNSPNYGGKVTLNNGAEYWINVWHKKSEKGNYFMSISVASADDKPVMDNNYNSDIDDEIIF